MHHPDSIPRHERHHRQYVDANPERIIPGTVPRLRKRSTCPYAFAVPYGREAPRRGLPAWLRLELSS